jgi:hypothetical protein
LEPPPSSLPEKLETNELGDLQLRLADGSYSVFVSVPGFRKASRHFDVTGSQMEIATHQTVSIMLCVGGVSGPVAVYPKDSLVLTADAYHTPVAFTPADFRALPHVNITVYNAHNNADETYAGVPLATLLAKSNVPLGKDLRHEALTSYLLASGSDGYSVLLSLSEVDPNFHAGQVLVADACDGQPLGSAGPYQLVVSDEKRPARWVHNLNSIALKLAP